MFNSAMAFLDRYLCCCSQSKPAEPKATYLLAGELPDASPPATPVTPANPYSFKGRSLSLPTNLSGSELRKKLTPEQLENAYKILNLPYDLKDKAALNKAYKHKLKSLELSESDRHSLTEAFLLINTHIDTAYFTPRTMASIIGRQQIAADGPVPQGNGIYVF